jgi:hypothetical protein
MFDILKTSKSQLTCHTLVTLLCLCCPICMSNHEYKFTIPTNGIALMASTWSLFWIDSYTKLELPAKWKAGPGLLCWSEGSAGCLPKWYRIECWYDTGTNTTFTWAKLLFYMCLHMTLLSLHVFARLYMFSHVAIYMSLQYMSCM